MISVNDFRTGLTIEVDNGLWQVLDFQHVKPGKGAAFVRSKLRNLRNGNMVDYKVPTFMDSDVDMKVTLVEKGHPEGPYGVKGIGEPGLVPTAAAIANAISHACNTDFDSLPIKPEHILFRKEVAD